MKNTNYRNVLITDRDVNILKLLSKLKIAETDLIRELISPEIKQNTFVKRLKKLELKGFIISLNEDQRGRTRNKLYGLNVRKKGDIEAIIWVELLGWSVDMSYSIYYHTLYIWYFLRFLVKQIRKKNKSYTFLVDDFISQYEFQKWTTLRSKQKWDTVIIPDWLLKVWNKIQWLECERQNSNNEYKKKLKGYKDQSFHLGKEWFCEFFEKDGKHTLLVMAPENKMWAYGNIMEVQKIKDYYYGVQLIDEGMVLKNQ